MRLRSELFILSKPAVGSWADGGVRATEGINPVSAGSLPGATKQSQIYAFTDKRLICCHAAPTQPPRGSTTTNSHQHPLIRAPCTIAPAHTSSLVSDHTRVSHAHARPLHPAALAFVPYGIVLVRVRADHTRFCSQVKSRVTPRGNMKAARSVNHRGLPGGGGLWLCMRRPQNFL